MSTLSLPSHIFCAALRLLEAVLSPRSPWAYRRLVVILLLAIVLVAVVRVPLPALQELRLLPLSNMYDVHPLAR